MPNLPILPCRAVAGVLLAFALAPGQASAHAILESSIPASGASVPAGKLVLKFRYNSRIDRERSRLVLTAPDHSQATLPIAPGPSPAVIVTSADLVPGTYNIRWQVLAVDGHITRGDVPFTVTAP